MNKKTLFLAPLAIMGLIIAGCGNKKPSSSSKSEESSTSISSESSSSKSSESSSSGKTSSSEGTSSSSSSSSSKSSSESSSETSSSSSSESSSQSSSTTSSETVTSTSSEEPPEPKFDIINYRVLGTVAGEGEEGWQYENGIHFADATNEEEVAEKWYVKQVKAEFDVKAGDTFKLNNPNADESIKWLGADFSGYEANENFEAEDETNNFKAKYSGSTTLYLKEYEGGNLGIAINFTKGVEPDPKPAVYTLKVGDTEAITLVDDTASKGELDTWIAQYKNAEHFAVSAGDKLVFEKDGEPIAPGASGEGNNALYDSVEGLSVIADNPEADIYLKVYNDGYDVWLTSPSPVPEPVYTLKVGDAEAITLVDASDLPKGEDTWIAQFKNENKIAVAAGEALVFEKDGEPIAPLASGTGNNALYDELTGITVAEDNAEADVYLKIYDDDHYDVWLTKAETPIETVTINMSVTKDAGWDNGIYLVGNFCDWNVSSSAAIKFEWTEGNVWVANNIEVQKGFEYHVKLVVAAYDTPTVVSSWEKEGEGNERVVTFTENANLVLEWGNY